jgi:hypothetical protein
MAVLVGCCLGVAAGCGTGSSSGTATTSASITSAASTGASGAATGPLVLDAAKDHGDKYANGILPVGDGHYQANQAKVGYVDACTQYVHNLSGDRGGAQARGPWFVNDDKDYDLNAKIHVQGHVMWTADFSMKTSGGTRTIVTNDLPKHPTGTFPIASIDPAYAYDHNPNSISGHTFTFSLPASPTYGDPQCMSGEAGVMLTGVLLFDGFDAGGRDAGAWEVQDSCDGHPQMEGVYHYHSLSTCITDVGVGDVIGFALDGFPITGPQVRKGDVLTTDDLDECHGITSDVQLDGKTVRTYHYVMTADFPYSVSCFRGAPITPPDRASGQGGGAGAP